VDGLPQRLQHSGVLSLRQRGAGPDVSCTRSAAFPLQRRRVRKRLRPTGPGARASLEALGRAARALAALDVSGCARWWRGRWGAWHRGTAGGGALAATTSGVCVGGAGCEQDVMAALDVSRTSGAGCERMRALAARPIGCLASWNGRWGWSR
jgi:hypothetical protein